MLLRLSSSHQAIYDPEEISRFMHQITGFEFRYVPPLASGTSENIAGSDSPEEIETLQQPDSSTPIPPALPTTMNIEEIGTQQSSSTTLNIEQIFTQQPESPTHFVWSTSQNLQQATNHSTFTMPVESGKPSNEHNNSSCFSCVGDHHTPRGLFDQDDLD